MAICIGQSVYKIIKKKKSAIVWILMAILTPVLLPALVKSEIMKIFIYEIIEGFLSSLGAVLLIAFIAAAMKLIYDKLVIFLDFKPDPEVNKDLEN